MPYPPRKIPGLKGGSFKKTYCTSPSNGFSTQLLFNLCVTKLHWCFTGWWFQNHAKWIIGDHQSPVVEQKHVETDNQINNPLNNSRDLTTCSAFHSQGAFPTGLSRPCCRSLVSCCSILFVPGPQAVKLGATMGVADSTNGSFFFFPGGGNLQNAQNGAWSFTCSVCFHYFVWEETQMNSSQPIVILIIGLIEGNILPGKSQSIWWTKTMFFLGKIFPTKPIQWLKKPLKKPKARSKWA